MHTLISPLRECMRFSSTTWISVAGSLLLILSTVTPLLAQTDLGSPYSVFGPGLPMQRASIHHASMGGAGAALSDPYRLNLINPAASAFHMDPVFEMGGIGSLSTFSSSEASFENESFMLNNLSLAFPIKRGTWNFNLGLVPLTRVSYDFVSIDENPDMGRARSEYRGNGGISQLYIGSAYRLYYRSDTAGNFNTLSFGGQMNFNFGPINNVRRISFPDEPTALGLTVRESYLVRDFSWEIGAQYQTFLIKKNLSQPRSLKLQFGAVYRLESNLRTELSNYVYNWRPTSQGGESPRDTLFATTLSGGNVQMPSTIILGVALDFIGNKRQRLRMAFDYSMQNWSSYAEDFPGVQRRFSYADAEGVALGFEFTPNMGSSRVLQRIDYRVGVRAERTGVLVGDNQIEDYGISFGLSLPVNMRRNLTRSRFSIGAEYGSFGTVENGLIREDYVRFMAGFVLTPHFRNLWFVQPKYD